ncbi:hypothetical protein EB796_020141 [Bugula neritina]|uniref:Uncharacterized protein n=1 Tax=Bugula neritina TaxID=10212 RepID=A0A7J7J6A2_BUGNE|nr:hypothetical protein EB796_020141 [Bugula neritina]
MDFYKPDYYKFIAAQGPKEGTAVDMWRLIHDTRANTIVMLTNLVENGKKKCWQYWPSKVSESIEFEDYTVTLLEEQVYALYIIKRQTTLFHYTKWYDHDIPSSAGLLSFRSRVRQHYGSSTTPIIVHCSAGVGRTGTYIALENLIDEAHDKRNHHKTVDVFACVNRLRHQRTLMVQTADQYAFLYDMVSEALSCGDTVIPAGNFSQQIRQWRVDEAPYWPTEVGGVITVSDISIINMKTQGFAEAITETTLEVQVSRTEQKHRVTLLEVKLKGQQLPTSQQLVVACQKSEKFATSDGSKVTVQCRNGSRVSGIFIIAMNLYLRTRIEHDIDIVLEVKLAREGRYNSYLVWNSLKPCMTL